MRTIGYAIATSLLMALPAFAADFRVVALTGDSAPGTGGEDFWGFPTIPDLTNSGSTAFHGGIFDGGINAPDNAGVWSEGTGGGLSLIARKGSNAPGTSDNFYSFGGNPIYINETGQTAFGASTGDGSISPHRAGIWSEGAGGGLELVAREGDVAPGTNGSTFDTLNINAFNNAGQLVFQSFLKGGDADNTSGHWRHDSNGLSLIIREGQHAAGTTGDVNYQFLGPVRMNDSGQVTFATNLTGADVSGVIDRGVWSEGHGGGLQLIARTGDPAPGAGPGTSFYDIGQIPSINNAGHIAFFGSLQGGDATDGVNKTGIWSEGIGGVLRLVARADDPVVDLPGTELAGFRGQVYLGGGGQTTFVAGIRGPGVDSSNNTALFKEDGAGGLKLIAREGDVAPGTNAFFLEPQPTINAAGQVAFLSTLTGPSVDSSNNDAIFAEDRSGKLRLIAREGQWIDVDPSPLTDLRKISPSSLTFLTRSGNQDGQGSGFNDRGEIIFRASFEDDTSGIFISYLATVPEPTTLVLVGWMVGVFAFARRIWT
jgi:hypothetical protein